MKKELNISILKEQFERKSERFNRIQNKEFYFKNCRLSIWEYYQAKGWYELLVNNDLSESKQAFYDASKTDIYYYETYNTNVTDLFSYGRSHVLETALSDSQELMQEYFKINYQLNKHGRKLVWYSDMINDGEVHIYCALINSAMNQDMSELKRLTDIVKSKCLKLKKNQWMNLDLNFFEGIIEKDTQKIEETISLLCTKEHKKRNKHSFFYQDIVSHPAQGYLKISWINELQINIDNQYIHKELLPIKPNLNYKDNVKELMSKMILDEPPENHNGQKRK